MNSHIKKINRDLIIGWMVIVGVLFAAYCGEVLKGERTYIYLLVFMAATALPAFFCLFAYLRKPDAVNLRYYIVSGYFLMYLFCMLTGSTTMVFSYILPMLSLLILYHQPKLILYTGIVSLVINLISIGFRIMRGEMNLANSKDGEIQIALLVLCFGGCYVAAKLYNEITRQNQSYLDILDAKNKQIQEVTMQAMMTIANTVDAKDEYTQGHSGRVSEYSAAIARELGMREEEVQNIRFVALLHDIGKIGVPESVLNKQEGLTKEEFETIKQHAVIGSEILKDITVISEADVGAKYHHERYDGKGYPEGLAGEGIPFTARIIAVADAYEAMTNDRVYRKRLPEDEVMRELREGIGTQFDPVVTKALIHLIEEDRLLDEEAESVREEELDDMQMILNRVMKMRREEEKGGIRTDKLTGCVNRSYGEQEIRASLDRNDGYLLLLDMDLYLTKKESYGFLDSDLWMKTVAECIGSRENEIVLRFGESHFAVFLEGVIKQEQAQRRMDELLEEIRKKGISVSIGTTFGKKQDSYSVMLQRAEKALYLARQQGGGRGCFFQEIDNVSDKKTMAGNDLKVLLAYVNNESGSREKLLAAYPQLEKADMFIKRAETANSSHRMQLLLVTMIPDKSAEFALEGQEWMMELLDKAILKSIHMGDMTAAYSSVQKIVILLDTDPEQTESMAEQISKEFYRSYGRRDVELYCLTADLD